LRVGLIILILGTVHISLAQKEYAHKVLKTLCSDYFAGRGYVDNGVDKAASYIINELKMYDIGSFPNHSYAQNYSFDVNTFPTEILVQLDNKQLIAGKNYLLNSNSGKSVGTYRPIDIHLKSLEKDLKNAVKSYGFSAILIFKADENISKDSLRLFRSAAIEATNYFPVIWLSKAKLMYSVGRSTLKNAFVTIQSSSYKTPQKIKLNIINKFIKDFSNKNIIGFIPGKKKKKYIVLTGHYDHLGKMGQAIFPGANDNASGVAMLLSLAKYFQIHKPKYTMVFIFFSGEEAGLEGSKYFVKHPFFELNRVKFLLNIDILGSASEGITAVNGTVHKKQFKRLTKLNKKGSFLPTINKRGPTQNSDHYYFSQTGVPSFFVYSMGNCKNYHDINDKAENTSLDNFDQVMNLFIHFLNKV